MHVHILRFFGIWGGGPLCLHSCERGKRRRSTLYKQNDVMFHVILPSATMSHPFPDVLFSLLLCLSTPGPFHTALPSFPSPYPFPPPPRAMYGYHSSPFPRATDSLADSPFPPPPPPPPSSHPPFLPDHFSGTDFDSLHETLRLLGSEVSNSCSSGCSSYGSPCSLGAHKPTLIQRSVSSHSLQKNGTHRVLSSVAELLESSETGPVRRVYSTGDLQVSLQNDLNTRPLPSMLLGLNQAFTVNDWVQLMHLQLFVLLQKQPAFDSMHVSCFFFIIWICILSLKPIMRTVVQGNNMVQHSYRSESPLSNESSMIIEGMTKACRYSPEEKKERIERYRSKRNQRNFNKKIKVAPFLFHFSINFLIYYYYFFYIIILLTTLFSFL